MKHFSCIFIGILFFLSCYPARNSKGEYWPAWDVPHRMFARFDTVPHRTVRKISHRPVYSPKHGYLVQQAPVSFLYQPTDTLAFVDSNLYKERFLGQIFWMINGHAYSEADGVSAGVCALCDRYFDFMRRLRVLAS